MSIEFLGDSINELSIASMALRILMSLVCSGVIGLERGKANQPAGMRTYMLVSLGACIVMITGDYVFYKYGTGDPARLGAQVVSGIGFLGGGKYHGVREIKNPGPDNCGGTVDFCLHRACHGDRFF